MGTHARVMSDLAEPRLLDERSGHWAETTPGSEAFTFLDRTWTWTEWDDRVRRLAGVLKECGVKGGDVVAFLDKNHPGCVELTLAAASLGAANAIVNFRLSADEFDYVLNDLGAKLLRNSSRGPGSGSRSTSARSPWTSSTSCRATRPPRS